MSKVILTGFPKLDRMIGSLDRARIIIVAGRPAVGKTAFAECQRDSSATYFADVRCKEED